MNTPSLSGSRCVVHQSATIRSKVSRTSPLQHVVNSARQVSSRARLVLAVRGYDKSQHFSFVPDCAFIITRFELSFSDYAEGQHRHPLRKMKRSEAMGQPTDASVGVCCARASERVPEIEFFVPSAATTGGGLPYASLYLPSWLAGQRVT